MKIGIHTAKNGQFKICEPTYLTLETHNCSRLENQNDKNKRLHTKFVGTCSRLENQNRQE